MHRAERDAHFTEFVAQSSARLLLLARHLCCDVQAAEDLIQSVLEKAYLRWGKVCQADDCYAYVRRMLINLNNDRLRRQPWREVATEIGESRTVLSFPGGSLPESELEQLIDRIALRRVLAELTPRERAVVVLRYLEDLSVDDTAMELGIKPGTVKSACNRALARLRVHSAKVREER
ncbi:MAG TPA: SigE family RNA polymerase sigma factor [Propionibacterium sp.]|jgi:RNA polymerase sigma-70 factor (sigma-E family)|nr:SigE family RNA polymerase sigma factor [Propionibacterium sp.]